MTPGQVDTAIEYPRQIADIVNAFAAAVECIAKVLEQEQQGGKS